MLLGDARPFDEGHRDPAVEALDDRVDDLGCGDRGGVAGALQAQLAQVHGQRDVRGEDQLQVDPLVGRGGGRDPGEPHEARGGSEATTHALHGIPPSGSL